MGCIPLCNFNPLFQGFFADFTACGRWYAIKVLYSQVVVLKRCSFLTTFTARLINITPLLYKNKGFAFNVSIRMLL